jgi:hypothetical protein
MPLVKKRFEEIFSQSHFGRFSLFYLDGQTFDAKHHLFDVKSYF